MIEFDNLSKAKLPFHALDGADGTGGDNLLDYRPALAVTVG